MGDTTTPPRWLEYVPVDDLPDHPDNPRDHDEATLRASVLRFGFTDPPMIDGRTGLMAEGHGRKKVTLALRDEGEPPPEGVVVADDGAWLVPVVHGWRSSSDDEARAYLLAGNIGGGWTDDLPDLLAALNATDDGLLGTGFTTDDLDPDLTADPDFQPSNDPGPRLDKRFHLVCRNCGSAVDPANAEKVEQ